MDTDAVAVLVAAAAAGSLSGAARRLGLTPMIATRRLAALERDLGVRLMQRTTRSVALTPEGEAFLPFAQAVLEGEAAGRASLRAASAGVSGRLRVSTSLAFGRKVVAPLVPRLLADHPELHVDLELTDHVVDLVASGTDLSIRLGLLRDSSMVARRLAPNPRVLCAAPAYVAARGRPETLDDLRGHECLALTANTHWTFETGGRERQVRVQGRFTANSIEALHQAALGGAGIALLSAWNVGDDLAAGTLVRIDLAGAVPQEWAVWAVYPSARMVLPKLRTFVSALEGALNTI